MSIEIEKDIRQLINDLTDQILDIISSGKKSGQFKPQKSRYRKWKLKDFNYSDKGVESTGASGVEIEKDNWDQAEYEIDNVTSTSDHYKKLVERINDIHPNNTHIINLFITKITEYCLTNEVWDEHKIDEIKQLLIREIKGEPTKSSSEVELVGIILRSKRIQISNNTSIRQPIKEDLEHEISDYSFSRFDFDHRPSAILTIEDYVDEPWKIQRREWLAIAILRLFKVGSVKWILSKMSTESLRGYGIGTMYPGDKSPPLTIAVIKESEEEFLRHFWKNIESIIPKSFFEGSNKEPSYFDIAHHRYIDGLMNHGPIESRITNAMMGLESIFLGGGELQELSYRLRMRVARLLSNFGYEPFEIANTVKDAYEVRSRFVHGGLLDYNAKSKLSDKYGSIESLITKLLDFLRLTIIITITISVSKDELIDIIDKSFLDSTYLDRLNQLVSHAKNILEIKK